ncbi:hypothetical protein CJ184_001105 [Actinotignum urinale]|uniref:hypothetical protein n=1 Tax=Actinotignum urinale TaxID=190146 RepID=UPI000CAA2797|nr:hypothetical protein [Actinotignum urinale]WIK59288.1 hypothetical protein CJ184_001105 [Actinotignum urinale]
MKLADIKTLFTGKNSHIEHLRRQRAILVEQQRQLATMVQAIGTQLEDEMTKDDMKTSGNVTRPSLCGSTNLDTQI